MRYKSEVERNLTAARKELPRCEFSSVDSSLSLGIELVGSVGFKPRNDNVRISLITLCGHFDLVNLNLTGEN